MKKSVYSFAHKILMGALLLALLLLFACENSVPREFSVTFDPSGGTFKEDFSATLTVLESSTLEKPLEPEKVGYTFLGWFTEAEGGVEYDFSSPVRESFTLYAHWTQIILKVSFNANLPKGVTSDAENIPEEQSVAYGSTISSDIFSKNPTLAGYYFSGWYREDNKAFEPSTAITEDITLYANWSQKLYSVTFDANDAHSVSSASNMPSNLTLEEGSVIDESDLITPSLTGYDFLGWTKEDGSDASFPLTVTSDISLKAKWEIKKFRVTFNENKPDGVTDMINGMPQEQTVEYGSPITVSTDPSLSSYKFLGWYLDAAGNTQFDSSTKITEETTLFAKWEKLAVVTFNYYGMSEETTKTVGEDYKLAEELLAAPANGGGGTFSGWFDERGNKITSSSEIKTDTTVYPMWSDYVIKSSEGVTTYHVYTEAGLNAWAEATNSNRALDCILLDDITLTLPTEGGSNWNTIGTQSEPYTGTFDGNGHTISNMTLNISKYNTAGMFGYLSGTVKNLKLESVNFAITLFSSVSAGGIAANCNGNANIENCRVDGTISATTVENGGIYAGGIIGVVSSATVNITACISEASVSAISSNDNSSNLMSGGIAGHLGGSTSTTTVRGCYASGKLTGPETNGIGFGSQPLIACYSTASSDDKHYGINFYVNSQSSACYFINADKGSEYGNTTKVDGTNVTWETAMNAMNEALETAGVNYRYELNSGNDSMPLVIKPI